MKCKLTGNGHRPDITLGERVVLAVDLIARRRYFGKITNGCARVLLCGLAEGLVGGAGEAVVFEQGAEVGEGAGVAHGPGHARALHPHGHQGFARAFDRAAA